jgi:hypothetical protein
MAKEEYGTRKKYHYIYKTTNLLSGKYYIGMHSTDNLEDGYLGSGTYLRRSINKHGKENHSIEILEFLNSREELAARESEIVTLQEIAKKECMNLKVGGRGGIDSTMRQLSKEKRDWLRDNDSSWNAAAGERVSQGLKRSYQSRPGNFTGKTHSLATIEKMKQVAKGRGVGNQNSQYGTCWITNGSLNKKIKKTDPIPEEWYKGRV